MCVQVFKAMHLLMEPAAEVRGRLAAEHFAPPGDARELSGQNGCFDVAAGFTTSNMAMISEALLLVGRKEQALAYCSEAALEIYKHNAAVNIHCQIARGRALAQTGAADAAREALEQAAAGAARIRVVLLDAGLVKSNARRRMICTCRIIRVCVPQCFI